MAGKQGFEPRFHDPESSALFINSIKSLVLQLSQPLPDVLNLSNTRVSVVI